MLLRIEDLDTLRCSAGNADLVRRDLEWLGLDWDFEQPPQSTRSEYYDTILSRLAEAGEVYPCWCTRGDLKNAPNAPHASDGARVYDGHCRSLTPEQREELEKQGRRPAWRVRAPEKEISFVDGNYGPQSQRLDRDCGDFILRRSDGVYAYQLAVAEDDGRMGVTRIVRGWDLLSSTPRQIWLLEELGYEPPEYCHLPLLVAPDGRRLSKRDRDLDMGVLRERYTPEALVGRLAHIAGLIDRPEAVKPYDLIPEFSWEKVGAKDRIV